ncbi:MAG TPA: HAD-IA family hydrolase [Candidatus Hydrogenedentes bacterium]|nr:HAD-IA family hydrolase [Candidatus Hydrogenedentota bacterium]
MSYGLIFDVDGVLADTESLIARATIEMYREMYDVELTPEDFRPFIGTGAVRYTGGPAETRGISIDLEKAIAKRHENFTRLLASGLPLAMPGALELIDAAASSPDWKLAIATSSPAEKAAATLDAAHIPLEKFTAFINGDMVSRKKPDPEIYETTAACLALSPASCVVVEDAVAGVTAAKAAGMKCVAVTNSFSAADLAKADLVVNVLTEVDLEKLGALLE